MHKLIIIFLVFILAGAVSAPASEPETALKVQERYDKLRALKADYTQILTNAATQEEEEHTGRIYFKKPMQVRWEAKSPQPELLVMDEGKVWNYFPEEGAVYEYQVEEVLDSRAMINFISGQAKLAEDFHIQDKGVEDGLDKLKLEPKNPEPDLVLAYIWADQDGLLQRILLKDFFGNTNELRFSSLETDPELDPDKFTFQKPEDAELR